MRNLIGAYPQLLLAVILLYLTVGCGGGGGSPSLLKGVLADGFGAVISSPDATITLATTGVIGNPGPDGSFSLEADPGSYTLRGYYLNAAAGIRLEGSVTVQLVKGQTTDIGVFKISNKTLEDGWAEYRKETFNTALTAFQNYDDFVRSGQADLGSSSSYSAIGWTYGRGLHDPVNASVYFEDALGGWNGNLDAWVGLSACDLSLMRSDGSFHFNDAVNRVTQAIEIPGEYSSYPTHDNISEDDLRAYRSFVNFLNGNSVSARNEALEIEGRIPLTGNSASADAIGIVLAFTD